MEKKWNLFSYSGAFTWAMVLAASIRSRYRSPTRVRSSSLLLSISRSRPVNPHVNWNCKRDKSLLKWAAPVRMTRISSTEVVSNSSSTSLWLPVILPVMLIQRGTSSTQAELSRVPICPAGTNLSSLKKKSHLLPLPERNFYETLKTKVFVFSHWWSPTQF